jgi:hypothetical protein
MVRRIPRVLSVCVLVAAAGIAAHYYAPPRFLPWKPLVLADAPGALTNWKLLVLGQAPQTCRAVMRDGDVDFVRRADEETGAGCGFENAGYLRSAHLALRPDAPLLSCPMAAASELWLREVVQPAALAHLGARVTSLQHFGTYSCRNVAGSSARSQHATANAIDVAGFVLGNGKQVSVLKHWSDPDGKGAFLRAVRDGGCGIFSVTLSPDYNAAHRDHFHFDLGEWQRCR